MASYRTHGDPGSVLAPFVAMPFAASSFLFLVVRPGAPSSILAPSNNRSCNFHSILPASITFLMKRVHRPVLSLFAQTGPKEPLSLVQRLQAGDPTKQAAQETTKGPTPFASRANPSTQIAKRVSQNIAQNHYVDLGPYYRGSCVLCSMCSFY